MPKKKVESKKKVRGYWQDFENAEREAQNIMKKERLDFLPGAKELIRMGYSSFLAGINKHHGGMVIFRKKAAIKGVPQRFNSLEYAIEQAKAVMRKIGTDTLPPADELVKMGYSTLAIAISKRHGGYTSFRRRLGESNIRKQPGYWQDPKNTLYETRKFLKKNKLNKIPTDRKMRELKHSSLCSAIHKYPGGSRKLREFLGEKVETKEANHWTKWENVKNAFEELIFELGHFPSYTEMKNSRYKSLSNVLRHYGGLQAVRAKMGYDSAWQEKVNELESLLENYVGRQDE